jgi:RimJ/RimL family protein N-acetyltransferase
MLSDAEQVWRISNQSSVREYSINKREIAWHEHVTWFENAISDPALLFYVLEWNGNVVGQLRYKRISSIAASVSISLSAETRGHGIAAKVLKEGDVRCFASWPEVAVVEAEISPRNAASIKTFLRAGYMKTDELREHVNQPFGIYRKGRQHAQ